MNTQKTTAFQLKAHYFPITVIKFIDSDLELIQGQISAVKDLVPKYFHHSPVVLDVTQLSQSAQKIDLSAFCTLLRNNDLIPVGVQGLEERKRSQAVKAGLAIWQANSLEKKSEGNQEPRDNTATSAYTNYVVTKPVRSGMHVYAQDSNLILLAPVNPGAECIADGDIHCYAPVRGRLLAGAKNNSNAQIFCQTLEAELVSIAGYYLTYDEFPENKMGYFRVTLNNGNHLEITNFATERSALCQK